MWVYKKKGRRYWYVEWRTWDGQKRQASTRTEDKQIAKKRAADIVRAAESRLPAYTLQEALNQLQAHKVRMNQSEGTMEVFRVKSGHLLRLFGRKRDLCALTLDDTEAYLDKRRVEGAADRTIEMELGTLRAALKRGKELGRYAGDVASLWPSVLKNTYNPAGRSHRWLTLEQFRQLYLAIPAERRDHLVVYVGTGVRQSVLYRLEARDLDREGLRVRVRGTKTRHAKRWVSPNADAWDVLVRRAEMYPEGPLFPDHWHRNTMNKQLTRCAHRAGLPFDHLSSNDMRRTFASLCLNYGVREDVIVRWMGHGSTQMVRQVYAQLGADEGAEQAAKLPNLMSGRGAGTKPANQDQQRSVLTPKTGGK